MFLKADLNKGRDGNTHRDWVYGKSVFSVEPGNLINSTKKPITFDSTLNKGK